MTDIIVTNNETEALTLELSAIPIGSNSEYQFLRPGSCTTTGQAKRRGGHQTTYLSEFD